MVVTSRAGAKHKDRALKEGAVAFLTKPVQEDQFVATIAGLIGAVSTSKSATAETAAAAAGN
jgi:FixJ family two-component response regulator